MIKKIIFVIFCVLLALWQISFLPVFPELQNYFNAVLLLSVLLNSAAGWRTANIFALIAGLTLDLYSPYTFGLTAAALLLVNFLVHLIFTKLFTRKTVYVLIFAVFSGTIVYHLFFWLSASLLFWLNWSAFNIIIFSRLLASAGWQILIHVLMVIIFWLLWNFIRWKISPNFLVFK